MSEQRLKELMKSAIEDRRRLLNSVDLLKQTMESGFEKEAQLMGMDLEIKQCDVIINDTRVKLRGLGKAGRIK